MKLCDLKNSTSHDLYEHFASKYLHELTIEELAYIHLNRMHGHTSIKNGNISSSLYDLIETAHASVNNNRTRIYTPMLACFSVLDQIGGVYRSKSKSTKYKNGIKIALDLFGIYSKNEIEYLTTLRNGLYHDGSLISKNIYGKINVVFRLDPKSLKTVTLPLKRWDGIYHDSLDDYTSLINVLLLKSDVENITRNCLDHLLNGDLSFAISDCREFFYKFLFLSEKRSLNL